MNTIDPQAVKAESEARIKALGGEVCDWLPCLDTMSLRAPEEICNRVLVMQAMIQLAFNAPKAVVRDWLQAHELLAFLSGREREILGADDELDAQTKANLFWYIEAVWALVWVGAVIPGMGVTEPVGSDLAGYLPNLRLNEGTAAFRTRFARRDLSEVFRELDLYYRAHWYTRNGQLNGYNTQPFELDIVMERRKALEWVAAPSIQDWDETPSDT